MSKYKIIIVHTFNIKVVLKCLSSLKESADLLDVFLVNNSTRSIKDKIKTRYSEVTIINSKKRLGYATAVNIGIKYALKRPSPEYLLILNDDTTFKKNFLNKLIEGAEEKNLGIASPKILLPDKKIWFFGGEIDKKRFTGGHKVGKLDYLSGCCLLIRKEVFDKIGLFDESYFLYYDDVDFCYRAKKVALKLGLVSNSVIYHNVKKGAEGLKRMNYYLARSHLLFVKKHAPLYVKLRELIRLPITLLEHYKRKDVDALRGIRDFFLRFLI